MGRLRQTTEEIQNILDEAEGLRPIVEQNAEAMATLNGDGDGSVESRAEKKIKDNTDSTLSTESENPVMNKVIAEELGKKLEGEVVGTTSPTEGTVGGAYDDTEIRQELTELSAEITYKTPLDGVVFGNLTGDKVLEKVLKSIWVEKLDESFEFHEKWLFSLLRNTDTPTPQFILQISLTNGSDVVFTFTSETKATSLTEITLNGHSSYRNKANIHMVLDFSQYTENANFGLPASMTSYIMPNELNTSKLDATLYLKGVINELGTQLEQTKVRIDDALADISAETNKVSKKTDDLQSATFNPFTRFGEAFAEGIAVPKFVANANADSTDYLPVPPRIVGRLYLSKDNLNYKISFLTTEKKFISNYAAPSTGVQDVNFVPPSNAAYMVITTYKAYTDQGYLMRQLYPVFVAQEAIKEDVAALKADTENLGTMQKTTYEMAANTRLSKGLPCNTGKVVLRFDMIEGSNSNSININRYTNNSYNAERLITGVELGKSYVLDIPEGDDGIWVFLDAGASAYKLVCTIENKLYERVSSVETKVDELQANQSWKGRTIVCFGDSLTEFKDIDNGKAYADYIHDITGAEVYNIGIGGSQYRQRMTPVANPTTSSEAYAALDMFNVVKACCEQEFSKQIAATNYLTANNLDRNDEIIARMQTIDWSKVDIVTFYGGGNDWNNASESWGEPSKDNDDINTTYGAINEIVRILLTAYPHLRIYWFSPSVSWQTDSTGQRTDATWSDNLKKNGTTKEEFAEIVMRVVKAHHLPICDMYNTLGWNQLNFSQFFTDTDGSHPRKGEGTLQTAKKIIAFINANRTF